MIRFFVVIITMLAMVVPASDAQDYTEETYGLVAGNCFDTRWPIDPDGDGPSPEQIVPVDSCFAKTDAENFEGQIANTYKNVKVLSGQGDSWTVDIKMDGIYFYVSGLVVEVDPQNRFLLDYSRGLGRIPPAEQEQFLYRTDRKVGE